MTALHMTQSFVLDDIGCSGDIRIWDRNPTPAPGPPGPPGAQKPLKTRPSHVPKDDRGCPGPLGPLAHVDGDKLRAACKPVLRKRCWLGYRR